MLVIHVLFGFKREPIHVGPSPNKNKSSASRYEIPKTDPNFFAQARFTSKKMKKTETGCKFRRRKSIVFAQKNWGPFSEFHIGTQNFDFFWGKPGVNRFTRESEKDVNPEHESRR